MFLSVMGLLLFVKLEPLMFDWMFLSSKLKAFLSFWGGETCRLLDGSFLIWEACLALVSSDCLFD